jgi:putative zinc finger protein
MDHNEAIKEMAAERYLLDELTPDLRDAFEEHAFNCPDCALDLRAGSTFINIAKGELPGLAATSPAPSQAEPARRVKKTFDWQSWLRPAFAVPAFAALLALVSYQNLSTIPSLRKAASEPSILPSTAFHAGTRGNAHTPVEADRTHGAALSIELPQDSGYASYAFDLYDPQGKQLWTRSVTAAAGDGTVSLVIPGAGLVQGSYTLAISGIDARGTRSEIDHRVLDIHFDE